MLLALASALWLAIHVLRERPAATARGGPTAVRAALTRWSTVETPERVHVAFDSVPTADVRDWLAALPAARTRISWEGAALTATAVAVEPVIDPKRTTRVWLAAPAGSNAAISDSMGLIDSVSARNGGAVITVGDVQGSIRGSVGGTTASAARSDSISVKPVLVFGVAYWETKFVVAALEEYGWRVDARFGLAPSGDVMQGAVATIDTSRYAAVIALDSSATKYASRIADYVRSGGGFIAAGDAAALPAFAAMLPGAAGTVIPEKPSGLDSIAPLQSLALIPIVQLKREAVPMESANGQTAVAAVRVGHGRVLQVGYLDTWRWRMGGTGAEAGDSAAVADLPRAHRSWWSGMVSSVAYAPHWSIASNGVLDPAPLATLVGALGEAAPQSRVRSTRLGNPRLLAALFVLAIVSMLLEVASRRLRGKM